MPRRLLLILAAAIILLAAADLVVWRFAEQRLEAGYAAWAAAQRQNGWTVESEPASRGGWPLAARLTFPAFRLAGGEQDLPGGLEWRAGRLHLQLDLFHPRHLAISGTGPQQLRLGGLPDLPFVAERLEASVPLDAGAPPDTAEIVAEHLRAGAPGQSQAGADALAVAHATLHLQARPAATRNQAALSFSLRAQDIDLPPGGQWALGSRIPVLEAEGAMDGPLPVPAELPVRLASWRDQGGTLAIQRLATVWGPLGLTASAPITLDGQLKPMGAIAARITGEAETLDKLAAGGAIPSRAALVAKAVLGLMPHTTGPDGKPQTDVQLTLQDRTLRLGQIPLARVPELDWTLNAAGQR
jgi:hypothetical protein